jgi:hypothetical protein
MANHQGIASNQPRNRTNLALVEAKAIDLQSKTSLPNVTKKHKGKIPTLRIMRDPTSKL